MLIASPRRQTNYGTFPFVPPSLVGAHYLHPPDAREICLHNDLLCYDTCSVTRGEGVCNVLGEGRALMEKIRKYLLNASLISLTDQHPANFSQTTGERSASSVAGYASEAKPN